jgi:hypothetical protein
MAFLAIDGILDFTLHLDVPSEASVYDPPGTSITSGEDDPLIKSPPSLAIFRTKLPLTPLKSSETVIV